jgi:2-polyprenyl-3-methyl-5-hydroxy-6-metoxy-1,4-benzoquinol methylase
VVAAEESRIAELNRAQVGSESDDFTEERYRQFASHFRDNDLTVLDIGCNTGRGGAVLKGMRPQLKITGIDCVSERVLSANTKAYDECLCGMADSVPLPDYSFDVIVGGEIIEHIPPVGIDKTLCELFRLLSLKGRVLLTTPNPYYIRNKWAGLSVLTERSHLTQHFPESLKARMKSIGFSNVKTYGTGRVSNYLGTRFPFLSLYGSYLITGEKW